MKQQTATFISARPNPPVWEVQFAVPQAPLPGMYVLAELGGIVRTPLFPTFISKTGFSSMVAPGHPATNLLPGTQIDILGPQGNGFDIDADRLLLIADIEHFPLLMPLINYSQSISMILEATSRLLLPSPDVFPPNVELVLVTLDGSLGYLGPMESIDPAPGGYLRANPALKELIAWSEQVCLALAPNRYPDFAEIIVQSRLNPRDNFAQAIIQAAMPCGAGVCDICSITTQRGAQHVCIDGPVFNLMDFKNVPA